jgi:hypothetical protein
MDSIQPSNSKTDGARFSEAIKAVGEAVNNAMIYFAALDPDDVPGLLRAFKALKEHKEALDGWTECLAKFYNQLSYETIPAAFERVGVDSVKLSGRNFVVGVRFNASIPQDKQSEGFKWLEEHGLGALIRPSVNPKSLSSALSGYIEEHAEEPPPEAFSIHKQKYTSVRKA